MILSNQSLRWTDPRTWPWFFYFWLLLMLAGWAKPLWKWLRRKRAEDWPATEGRIESTDVKRPGGFSVWKRSGQYVAELGYSYSVVGERYGQVFKREFSSEPEAWDFVRDLKGKPMTVHFNPSQPSSSTLSNPDLEKLLQARAPQPFLEDDVEDSVPNWLKPLVWIFVAVSAVGLVLSLWIHIGSVMGRRVAPAQYFWILHVGIFVVWFPALLLARRRVGNVNRKDFWKVVLKNSPEWMRYMVYGFGGYALLNCALFLASGGTSGPGNTGLNPSANVWRGFSGHWMVFYSAALAILYSAVNEGSGALRCVNGHRVSRVLNASMNGDASSALTRSQKPESSLKSGRASCFSKPTRQMLMSRERGISHSAICSAIIGLRARPSRGCIHPADGLAKF
jgi:hypothetical protein